MESLATKESQWRDLNSWPLPYQGNALPLSYIGKKKRARDRVRTGDIQLGRLTLYQLSYSRILILNGLIQCWHSFVKIKNFSLFSLQFRVGRAGFEPAKLKNNRFTVCPRWPLEYLPIFNEWSPAFINWFSQWLLSEQAVVQTTKSRWRDSNPRPADYKSAALASWATSA
jgi:hypothetical protein